MGKQYLTFTLADTIYAVNVFQVREVLSYVEPQALPNPDPVIEGLIRSRGQSISVINLRRRFGLEDRPPDRSTRIIVLEIHDDESGEENIFGAIADGVNEVVDLEQIGFEDTPELGNSPAANFIQGIGRQDEHFIIILDADKIFSFSEISLMEDVSAGADVEAADTTENPTAASNMNSNDADTSMDTNAAASADTEAADTTGDPTAAASADTEAADTTGNPTAAASADTDAIDMDIDGLDSDIGEFEEL